MRHSFLPAVLLAIALLAPPKPADAAPRKSAQQAAVKIFSTQSAPDLSRPWQRKNMEQAGGSGVILENGLILTNAHVVANGVSIEVKLDGATERYPAEVVHLGSASDLALIRVDDPAFFEGSHHLDLGTMPRIQDPVEVIGYPEGGESLSITAGVVSRIEIGAYAHSMADMLLTQIDAAINPGNSGGPVVANGKLVGVAVQGRKDSQNIGYMVPLPVIRQFLNDAEDGRIDGPQTMGIGTQDLESPAHRARYGLDTRESGVVVNAVNHGSPAWGVLEPGDVILAIDGQPLANDLSVASPYGTRLSWVSLLTRKQAGDDVKLRIVRDGERRDATVRLHSWQHFVPGPNMSDATRYRIFGGLVFQPLTVDYLIIDPENTDNGLVTMWQYRNLRTPERAEPIILAHVLPCDASRGYFDWIDEVVLHVNGQTPRDMAHLNEILDTAADEWIEFEMESGVRFVLDLEQARAAMPDLLEKFAISADRSPIDEEVAERVE